MSTNVDHSLPTDSNWLGVSVSVNDSWIKQATVNVPSLVNGCPPLCEGCEEPKSFRGHESSSLICCFKCWRKLPKWMRRGFITDQRCPAGGDSGSASIWENRIAVTLMWMREANAFSSVTPPESKEGGL